MGWDTMGYEEGRNRAGSHWVRGGRAFEALQRLGKFPSSAMMLAATASAWAQCSWLLRPPEFSYPGLPLLILACPHPAWRQLGGVAQPENGHCPCPLAPTASNSHPWFQDPAALRSKGPLPLPLPGPEHFLPEKLQSLDLRGVASSTARPTTLAHLSASQVTELGSWPESDVSCLSASLPLTSRRKLCHLPLEKEELQR